MTKLSDVKPGQFFRQIDTTTGKPVMKHEIYLKIWIDSGASYKYTSSLPRKHLAIRTSNFKVATWAKDGDVDVEIVNPEDV